MKNGWSQVVARGLNAEHLEPAKDFLDLLLAEAPFSELGQDTVVADDAVLGLRARVPGGEAGNLAVDTGEKQARAHSVAVCEDLPVVLVPVRLFRSPSGVILKQARVAGVKERRDSSRFLICEWDEFGIHRAPFQIFLLS